MLWLEHELGPSLDSEGESGGVMSGDFGVGRTTHQGTENKTLAGRPSACLLRCYGRWCGVL